MLTNLIYLNIIKCDRKTNNNMNSFSLYCINKENNDSFKIFYTDNNKIDDLMKLDDLEVFEPDINDINKIEVYLNNNKIDCNISYINIKKFNTLIRYEIFIEYKDIDYIINFYVDDEKIKKYQELNKLYLDIYNLFDNYLTTRDFPYKDLDLLLQKIKKTDYVEATKSLIKVIKDRDTLDYKMGVIPIYSFFKEFLDKGYYNELDFEMKKYFDKYFTYFTKELSKYEE